MKKIIKKWGDSCVITLDPEDMKVYEMKVGDIIDIEICFDPKTRKKCKEVGNNDKG